MRIPKRITLSEWAKGKPVGLVIMAQQLAISAEGCFEILKSIKTGERIDNLAQVQKADEWVKLYRNRLRMVRGLIEELRKFGGVWELIADILGVMFLSRGRKKKKLERIVKRSIERIRRMSPDKREKVRRESEKEMYHVHLADIQSDIDGKIDAEFEKKLREALKRAEVFFYVRVWVACGFLYRDYPPRMLRRARLGDVSATEKLLRLDTRVLNDPKVSEYLYEAKSKSKKRTLDRLTEALRSGPKPKMTLKKVKCSIGGLISLISIMLSCKLKEPQIRELFDAVAHDTGKGDIDTDLPESPEAFAKAIQRERGFWMPTLFQSDKK